MPGVFISYRRQDTPGEAGRLYDRLRAHFGPDRVFMDVSGIKPGVDFVDTLQGAVGSCDALLAMIGREWVSCTDRAGRRRLDDPNDFVRLELLAALERDVRVVPVLVEGAGMPTTEELPEALRKLARRQAVELRHSRWDDDVEELIKGLEDVVQAPKPATPPAVPAARDRPIGPRPPFAWQRSLVAGLGVGGLGLSLLLVGIVFWRPWARPTVEPTPAPPTLASPEPKPSSTADPGPVEFERTDEEKAIQAEVGEFQQYLKALGLDHTGAAVKVHLRPKDGTGAIAWYDPRKRLISIHRDYADDLDVVLREYANYALTAQTADTGLRHSSAARVVLGSGLAFYLPCSFHDSSTFGSEAPTGRKREHGDVVFDLDNASKVTDLTPGDVERYNMLLAGKVWGGAFWAVRKSVGRETADPSLMAAWKETPLPPAPDEASVAFALALIDQVKKRVGSDGAERVRAVLRGRGFRV